MKSRNLLVDLCCATVCLFIGSSALAQTELQFTKANQEYAAGHFKEAIDGYESLAHKGVWSTNLFYDLGNAYFHTGDLGRAILNYERALVLDRRHPEAQANLRIAHDEARALEMTPTNGERLAQFADANQYAIAAVIAFWLSLFSIAWWIFSRRSSGVIMLPILSLSIFGLAVISIFWNDHGTRGRALAIVTQNQERGASASVTAVAARVRTGPTLVGYRATTGFATIRDRL